MAYDAAIGQNGQSGASVVALARPIINDGKQMAMIRQSIQSKIIPLARGNQRVYYKIICRPMAERRSAL